MKLFALATLSTILLCNAQESPLPSVSLEKATVEGLGISTSGLEKHLVADPVNATARIIVDPARTRSISSFFSGQVDKDLAQPGQSVEAGDTLAILKSREVATVISRFIETDSKLNSATLLFEREQKLLPEKLTTEDDFLAAKANYQSALANHRTALKIALLTRSTEELTGLLDSDGEHDLTTLPVKAPSRGTVIKKNVYAGDAVAENTELFELADLDQLLVRVRIPLKAAPFVSPGDQLEFQTVIGPEQSGKVKVSRIEPIVDQDALSVTAFATLDNSNRKWLAGTPVNLSIIDSKAQPVTAVPTPALVSIGGVPHLFIEKTAGTYHPVPVQTGQASEKFTEISAGLPDDARVVVTGASLLLAAWEERTAE